MDPATHLDEGRLDLVPLIDCIMLLLLFFMLTMTFTKPEKVIASVLPPQGQAPVKSSEPPPAITIAAWPDGMQRGGQPSDYARAVAADPHPRAILVRVGAQDPIRIDLAALRSQAGTAVAEAELTKLHAVIAAGLIGSDLPAVRRHDQPPIVLRVYSGLPWRAALAIQDAVRAYESAQSSPTDRVDPADPLGRTQGRAVITAPPLLHGTRNRIGNELFEIIHGGST